MLRPNLAYMVLRDDDKKRRLLRIVTQVGGCGIVYTRNRRGTQAVAQFLVANGITATFYHAGLDATERDSRQAAWMKGSCRVMVATNAFGMGVDKGDVRFVVHLDLPDSPEAYFRLPVAEIHPQCLPRPWQLLPPPCGCRCRPAFRLRH